MMFPMPDTDNPASRILNWEGCKNVRDLGGLRAGKGRLTRRGQIVRSDTPGRLTAAGWAALYDYGIRTIITLRTHGMEEEEDKFNYESPYADITLLLAAIEDITDQEFVDKWVASGFWSTPLYYPDALQHWPQRHAAVISAIARAQPGGVLFHCIRGVDRTGIISLLLLALAGVEPEEILIDYELSNVEGLEEMLAAAHTSTREAIFTAVAGLDIENYLLSGGATPADLAAVRQRLLG